MLGIRLDVQVETDLDNYARAIGRSKSAIVRELIARHLEAHSIDEQMRRAVVVARETDVADHGLQPELTIWND